MRNAHDTINFHIVQNIQTSPASDIEIPWIFLGENCNRGGILSLIAGTF